ncbi:MAG: carbohydrate-binding domain-containing protein [Mariniblastus sp.]
MNNNLIKNQSKNVNPLNVEVLEDRMMLSAVQIFAIGETGQESFQLKVDDQVVATFDNVGGNLETGEYQEFLWTTDDRILSADQIRVEFINDSFDPVTGVDRNLYVDKIRLDGVVYESESPSTFSTGMWADGGLTGPGFFETEQLNINGSFIYSSDGATPIDPGTRIRVDARGTTGDEIMLLQIDGNTVAEFDVSTESDIYLYTTSELVSPDQIRVAFANDLFDAENGIDRNLIVEKVQVIDLQSAFRQMLSPTDANTFSTGTWFDGELSDGFGRGDTLHSNGYFQFDATPAAASSQFVADEEDVVVPSAETSESTVDLGTDLVEEGANVALVGSDLEEEL